MNRHLAILLLAGGSLLSAPVAASTITCKMTYTLTGWSFFYKHASGNGVVRCSNGQTLPVRLSAKGGGPTIGKHKVNNGFGEFAGVRNIRDVLGTYVAASADAAAGRAATAQAMTKGDVSLALSGKGEGWNLGVAFTGFTIKPR